MSLNPPNLIYSINTLFVDLNVILLKLDLLFKITHKNIFIFLYKYYMYIMDLRIIEQNCNISSRLSINTNFNIFIDLYIYDIKSYTSPEYRRLSNFSHFHKILYSISLTHFLLYDYPSFNEIQLGIISFYSKRDIE